MSAVLRVCRDPRAYRPRHRNPGIRDLCHEYRGERDLREEVLSPWRKPHRALFRRRKTPTRLSDHWSGGRHRIYRRALEGPSDVLCTAVAATPKQEDTDRPR